MRQAGRDSTEPLARRMGYVPCSLFALCYIDTVLILSYLGLIFARDIFDVILTPLNSEA